MNRMRIASIGLVLFVASCGSSTASSNQSPEQSQVDSVLENDSTEDGLLAVDEAGRIYLEIVNPVNCAIAVITDLENENSLGDGTIDPAVLSDVKAAAKVLASARENAIRLLLEQAWPSIVLPDIEILAREWSKSARAELAVSESVDLGAYNLAISSYRDLSGTSQANPGFIRASLGIGPASETDRC